MTRVSLLALPGSTRAGSYNRALARAAPSLAPDGVDVGVASIAPFPVYDGDLEAERGVPEAVEALKDRIATADGLLVVTPEYNHSMPGPLKNALDWLSRPPKDATRVFGGLPVALAGATPGAGGTRFAHVALLPVLHTLGTRPWFGSQLYVARAGDRFDDDLRLVDEPTRERVAAFVEGFAAFAERSRRQEPSDPSARRG